MSEEPRFYWHLDDELLAGPMTPVAEKVLALEKKRGGRRWKVRQRLIKPVKGYIPLEALRAAKVVVTVNSFNLEVLWPIYDKAERDDATAKAERDRNFTPETDAAFKKVHDWNWHDLWKVKGRFDEIQNAAWNAFTATLPLLESLHAKECRRCPWDGTTIFPGEFRG